MVTKIGNGIAVGNTGFEAGKAAAEMAKEKLGTDNIDLVIVFSSLKYHLDDVYNGVKEISGDALLVGASSSGEFTSEKSMKESVVVSFVSSDSNKFFAASVEDVKDNTYEKVRECIDILPADVEGFPHLSSIVLHDGLIGSGEAIITQLGNAFQKKINFVGGTAGDDLKFEATYVIHNGKVMENALVLLLIASKNHIGLGVEHGHMPVSEKLIVTKAKGNVLYKVNGRPAWDVWRDELKDIAKEKDGIDVYALKDAGNIGGFLLKYEMGLALGDNKYKVRIPLTVNQEDGSINFAVEIFEGAEFNIMHSVKERQIQSATKAAQYALANFRKNNGNGPKVAGAFIFDCVCRGLILEEDFHKAIEEMNKVLDNVPLVGFETYGEICRGEEEVFSGFHNTTSVVMLLPD